MSQDRITAAPRPFILTFRATEPGENYRSSYPLHSEECQRLLDAGYPVLSFTAGRVVLQPDQPGLESILEPATLGGGPAFTRSDR